MELKCEANGNWVSQPLAHVAPLQRGFDLPTSQLRPGPYPVVYSNGVSNFHAKFQVKGPGIVTGRSGTIGNVHFVEQDFWPHNTSLWVTDFKGNDPKFIYYLLADLGLERFGTGSGVPTLNRNDVHDFVVSLPSAKHEQKAIATALSDVDALISSQDQLIVKKRDIKQATMQQLLTGKQRLPGFSGEWDFKQLGDLFEITSSKRVFQSEWQSEGIPFYRARELAVLGETGRVDNELFIKRKLYEAHRKAFGVPEIGDMLVTGVGTLGKVYVVTDDHEFYFKDGNIIWFRIGGKMSAEFLRQLYLTETVMKQIAEGSAGTTVGTYTITAAKKTKIPLPPLREQFAIATILSDMDTELVALEQKRDKIKALKQGMMQELLTGRLRLV